MIILLSFLLLNLGLIHYNSMAPISQVHDNSLYYNTLGCNIVIMCYYCGSNKNLTFTHIELC